jgi:hypothetical protein
MSMAIEQRLPMFLLNWNVPSQRTRTSLVVSSADL